MIDPFFLDRLMHAFTTAHATPLSMAAAHAASRNVTESVDEPPKCRALREGEEVAAATSRRQETTSAESPRDDRRA